MWALFCINYIEQHAQVTNVSSQMAKSLIVTHYITYCDVNVNMNNLFDLKLIHRWHISILKTLYTKYNKNIL